MFRRFVLFRLASEDRGTNHDCNQDYRYHYSANPEHPALWAILHLARNSQMPLSAATRKTNPLTSSAVCPVLPGRTLILCYCAVLVLTLLQPKGVSAQAPENDIVRVSTDLLLFPVRVRNKQGQAVTGLTERDLSLRDEDHATTALYFAAGGDRVALVFALDQSGSLREIISQQREAALALFGRFSQRSRIAILRFAQASTLVAPFDRDIDAARAAFAFATASNQHTAIFDAAANSVNAFERLTPDIAERRIVVLISDGLDNASKTKAREVIEMALDKRVSFYVIHLPLFEPRGGRLAVRQPARGFRELAERTGGKYFLVGDAKNALAPNKSNNLTPVFQAIEEDLRSQYLLGFYIAEAARDGRKHSFSVGLMPAGLEFFISGRGYSRRHTFLVNLPRASERLPE